MDSIFIKNSSIDENRGESNLKSTESKCLHYYFYFIDAQLGLCYLRVPTWAPFRLQFFFNGHNALASKLECSGISNALLGNAFVNMEDFERGQQLADSLRIDQLHKRLSQYARMYCPVVRHFPSGYHWSLMQVEYATDIVFNRQTDLQPLYEVTGSCGCPGGKSGQYRHLSGSKIGRALPR